jgi:uncharacterized protein
MSEVTGPYPPGKPCWFDITVSDPKTVKEFYEKIFGWKFESTQWDYDRAFVRGKAVAAIGSGEPEEQSNWTTYLATGDVEATVRSVEVAGGKVIKALHEAPTGKLAVVADPGGGYFGLWQGGAFHGSELTDEPGAPCWTELASKDTKAAAKFFEALFGLETKRPFPRFNYVQLRIDGKEVAGILGYTHERRPKTGHAAWLVYFEVADTDAAVRTAVEHGGTVIEKPEDSPFGRRAVLADPAGAGFAVITRPAR